MKTFDEAIDTVCFIGTSSIEADKAGERIASEGARFREIGDEAQNNEKVDALIFAHARIMETRGVEAALFSMLMVGLTIGIEMERAEVGMLAA